MSIDSLHAQTGPGGVGDLTGTSTLEVWLDANDLDGDGDYSDNPANGTQVSVWMDKSGNNNHLRQNTAARRPLYYVSGGQYNAVYFVNDGGTTYDYMTFDDDAHLAEGTVFFVLVPIDVGSASNSLLDDGTRSLRIEQYEDDDDIGYTRYNVNDYETDLSSNYGNISIVSFRKDDNTNNMTITQNGTSTTISVGSNAQAGIPLQNMGRSNGNNNDDAGSYRVIEIIVHSKYLNNAEMRIIENYLSAKYNEIAIPNDQYVMDESANGDHDHEMAGIGQLNAANAHLNAQSSIVRINNAQGLGNNEFFYWGHNNLPLNSSAVDVPSGIEARFNRVWGGNEVGTINAVNITFNLTDYPPVTASDLRLLIDTDNDGVFGEASTAQITCSSSSGNEYTFQYNFPQNASRRFTLGTIDKLQTPLPVELTSFEVTYEPPIVVATWETASETNNDYFTLERAGEDLNFYELLRQPGAGTSTVPRTYSAIDPHPFGGRSYYRLKQTDYDGKTSYSDIRRMDIDETGRELVLYPNPNNGREMEFSMGNTVFQLQEVEVINSQGIALERRKINASDVSQYTVNLDKALPPGFYLVRALYNGKWKGFRVVVQ